MNEFQLAGYKNSQFTNVFNPNRRTIRSTDYKSTDLRSGDFIYSTHDNCWLVVDSTFQNLILWFESNFVDVPFWNQTLKYLLAAPKTIEFRLPTSTTYQGYVGMKYVNQIQQAFLSFASLAEAELGEKELNLFRIMKRIVLHAENGVLKFIFWKRD